MFFDDPSIEQTRLAPEKNTITFSSAPALGRFVQSKEKEAEESGCYLVINHVVDTDITKIKNALRGRGLRKQIRLTYENTMELLIMKFIPGLVHEITSGLFFHQIASKICAIPGHTPCLPSPSVPQSSAFLDKGASRGMGASCQRREDRQTTGRRSCWRSGTPRACPTCIRTHRGG